MKIKIIYFLFFYLICFLPKGYSNDFKNHTNENDISVSFFEIAKPIWPLGQQFEKNLSIRFQAEFEILDSENATLKVAGSSLYRIYLNDEFIAYGPARAAHGFYRVDEVNITKKLIAGTNYLTIEVAGYNINSYYLLDQPSFLQAEVLVNYKVVAATNENTNDFRATQITERIQKVPRYSFQRTFVEVYNLSLIESLGSAELKCEEVESKNLISRNIKFSDFLVRNPKQILSAGKVTVGNKQKKYWKDRAVRDIGDKLGGFSENELTTNPAIDLQEIKVELKVDEIKKYISSKEINFYKNSFQILDFGLNTTGFIGAEINCINPCRVYFTFDEILSDNDVDFKRLGCINSVTYNLEPGKYSLESFEPYTFRYLKIIVVEGECNITNVYLREYANSDISKANFYCSDERLNRIYDAGVETFKQNVVDVFMDCPSRERAGWLCDSYFSSRVAADLSGNTLVEKNFLENFLLPDSFEFLPEGMLPMCYPADHNDGVFIPNWAMWFVIQLQEYLYRSNDRKMVDELKPKVLALLRYFEQFENNNGLLESLDSWIFVEWSEANSFVQDVNYPTNMLYSATLETVANLYNLPELKKQADRIKDVIREQAFNGQFFVDNAIRKKNGDLEVTNNITEVCQYYAFFFNVASPELYPELWHKLVTQFGPERKNNNPFPEVYLANAFIGNYLRLELLSRNHENARILSESVGFFDYMAKRTGTLWENISTTASCNHGFASHVVHLFYRDVLGIYDINIDEKTITIQFSNININSCKGQVPIGNNVVQLEWERSENTIQYKLNLPEDYKVEIKNTSGSNLIEY
ncbi:MAG: hypothetical protein KAH68_00105 [Draconibacterium sp.]|nr:hypothetical protein [Draconibacterium sp.]